MKSIRLILSASELEAALGNCHLDESDQDAINWAKSNGTMLAVEISAWDNALDIRISTTA